MKRANISLAKDGQLQAGYCKAIQGVCQGLTGRQRNPNNIRCLRLEFNCERKLENTDETKV